MNLRPIPLIFILFLNATLYAAPANLVYQKELDFGKVYHGDVAKLSSTLINHGQEKHVISKVQTSCGCTSADLPDHQLEPGKELKINFEIDTLDKVGPLRKTARIYFENDPAPLILILSGEIVPHPEGHMKKDDHSHLFSEKCASCHVQPTKGKQGRSLYLAACAMCHGTLRRGGSAPPLLTELYQDHWKDILISGGNQMPGFSSSQGGILDESQIASLLTYLKNGEERSAYESKSPALLFYRWCAPCHGSSRMGPIGPDIRTQSLGHYTHESLEAFLSHAESPLMPGFSKENGGPFSSEEISSLVLYLLGPKH